MVICEAEYDISRFWLPWQNISWIVKAGYIYLERQSSIRLIVIEGNKTDIDLKKNNNKIVKKENNIPSSNRS